MLQNLNLSDYDFTGKKVRYNGKCLSKFDLGQHLDSLKPFMAWFVSYDVFSYDELVSYLKKYLNEMYKN